MYKVSGEMRSVGPRGVLAVNWGCDLSSLVFVDSDRLDGSGVSVWVM
jgi:hypothetical protein